MSAEKARELASELRMVFAGRGNLVDSILPPLAFVVFTALGLTYATWAALGLAIGLSVVRAIRGQRATYALGGLGAALLAVGAAWFSGSAQGFFLPDLVTGGLTAVVALVSAIVRRPMVAWTSHLVRGWPLGWYWHPQVRPAHSEVALAWALYFAVRLALKYAVLSTASPGLLGVVNLLSGWPATIPLLVISYLYGTWRLGQLAGASVDEFKSGAQPPWQGQRRGF